MPARVAQSTTDDNDSTTRLKHFVEHSHGSGASSSNTYCSGAGSLRPQIYEAKTKLGDKNTFRNQQEVPREVPQENSEKQPDHFKVIKTLNLMDQYTKKSSQVTDAGGQDIAEIVKVKDIEESDLPKNTKSSKKYKIAIDESAETVEKAKTTTNNIVRNYHNEVTHPDEVHEECVVQSPYW